MMIDLKWPRRHGHGAMYGNVVMHQPESCYWCVLLIQSVTDRCECRH